MTMKRDLKGLKKGKERLLTKVSKQQVTGNNDETNIAVGLDQELFSYEEHKNIAKMGYVDLDADAN